jgi:hypothetical protein
LEVNLDAAFAAEVGLQSMHLELREEALVPATIVEVAGLAVTALPTDYTVEIAEQIVAESLQKLG